MSVNVIDENNNILKFPWAGGLNSCQFSAIDLNNDGIKDLLVFDKCGNRILIFINNAASGKADYIFAPEYTHFFPALHDWVILYDYNHDGKEDIFSSGIAGIEVYKNISNASDGLKFQFITHTLNAWQGSSYTNIFCSSAELPAFSDIDNDGDMDILSFFPLGSYVYYFRNYSMEKYNNPDSLDFRLEKKCWGDFAVSSNNNHVFLDVKCPWKCASDIQNSAGGKKVEHMGNTLLAIDSEGNGVKDIILGDFDYPGLNLLTNIGKPDSAHIDAQDTVFPSNSKAVDIVSFPAASSVDVDNDGLNDIIVSPFEGRFDIVQSLKSVWLYKNTGTLQKPVYTFQSDNFLQGDMIDVGSGAYPVFFDYDSDGLTDIILSNYGYRDTSYYVDGNLVSSFRSKLALLRNTGTKNNPDIKLINRDFANISALKIIGAYPAFADLDADGDIDMLLGNADGTLIYYENTAGKGNPANFVLNQKKYQNISAGQYSTPQLFDINGDSLKDLVIGNRKGTLYYYKNTGTKNVPLFTLITKTFGMVNVADTSVSYTGYSVPCLFRAKDNKLRLFVGSEQGRIHYFKDIEANINGKFTVSDQLIHKEGDKVYNITEGDRAGVAVADIDHDGFPDVFIGNSSGGLSYFKGITPPEISSINDEMSQISKFPNFQIFPNPASNLLNIKLNNSTANSKYSLTITNFLGQTLYNHILYSDICSVDCGLWDCRLFYLSKWYLSLFTQQSLLYKIQHLLQKIHHQPLKFFSA